MKNSFMSSIFFYKYEYSSAESKMLEKLFPPAANTFPSANTDVLYQHRALFILLVIVQIPVDGSYISQLFVGLVLLRYPPHANTFPFVSIDAENNLRGEFILPVSVQLLVDVL